MNIINQKILSLNANWQIIGIKTVKDTFVSMMGGNPENPPVKALDISYPIDKDGNYLFQETPSIIPVSWVEWMSLPIRDYDKVINTANLRIRIPTVTVSVNYNKMPKRNFNPSKEVLYNLQKGRCGLTNRQISLKQGNIEHKTPKSKGGKETFENLMFVDKKINSLRGNKDYEELGLKPLFHHKQPAPVPVSFSIKNIENIDWFWFVENNK